MFGPLTALLPFDYYNLFPRSTSGILASFLSFINADFLKFQIKFMIKYFHIFVIVISGFLFIPTIGRENIKAFFEKNAVLVLFATLAVVFHASHIIIPLGLATQLNALYFMPFYIITVAGIINLFYIYTKEKKVWGTIRMPIATVLLSAVLLTPVSIALVGPDVIFFNHFDYADSDLSRVKRGAAFIKEHTTEDDIIFSIDNPHHVFMAGRYEIPPLINGIFTYSESDDVALLRRYRSYNTAMLFDWLEHEATVAIFQKDFLDDSALKQGEGNIEAFLEVIENKFEEIGSISNVYPDRNVRGDGKMYIYRKK